MQYGKNTNGGSDGSRTRAGASVLAICALFFWYGCNQDFAPTVFEVEPGISLLSDADPLRRGSDTMLNGIYTVETGTELLGDRVAILSIDGRISVFCEPEAAYLLLDVGTVGPEVVLEGYWRKGLNLQNGVVQLKIMPEDGAREVIDGGPAPEQIVIQGMYDDESDELEEPVRLRRTSGLRPADSSFAIIGHRGGGRNSDYLPHSENSLEMIRFAPRLGCNAVELDVLLTSDGVPIVFHDLEFSTRTIREEYLVGPVANYSWQQIRSFATLVNGEKIPTLEEALNEVEKIPQIRLVWIDVKTADAMREVAPVIARENRMRQNNPKRAEVLAGIPLQPIFDAYRGLRGDDRPNALCELGPDQTRQIDAEVWAPRWTLGLQEGELAAMQAEGRRGFVWTVDLPEFIRQFVQSGYDGVLSNYPTLVAWNYYVRGGE